jgi:hypothetical protein
MSYITDDCIEPIKEILVGLVNSTWKPCIAEIMSLRLALKGIKEAQPNLASVIDQQLEMIRHSEDIRQSVERQAEKILKVLNSIDKSNADQVLEALWQQLTQKQIIN